MYNPNIIIKIIKGNSLKILTKLPPKSFNMIFVDPPYFLSGKGVTKPKGEWDIPKTTKEQYKFHKTWINQCKSLLAPSGTIWITGSFHSIHTIGHILTNSGFKIINEIAWHKNINIPTLTKRQFPHRHETILWAKLANQKYLFNYELAKNKNWLDSVWYIKPPQKSEQIFGHHPTQKPTELLRRIILVSTQKGDNILDPFTGTGATAVVSKYLGRNFTGIEKEEKYIKIAKNRLNKIKMRNKT